MSWYLTIRSDADYSCFTPTAALVDFLASLAELRQTGPVAFTSAPGVPSLSLLMAECGPTGNYASDGAFLPRVNMVELVCWDDDDAEWYDALACRIAKFLGWSAFDDSENRQLCNETSTESNRTVENEKPEYMIPAASIGDTNLVELAKTHPEAANEIARLDDRLGRGEETLEDLRQLCQLLFDVGAFANAEILLRRNIEFYDDWDNMYARLFGTVKQDEFTAAIKAFETQFELELKFVKEKSFLISIFHATPGPPRADAFALLSDACEIEFAYLKKEIIEADVGLIDPDAPNADEYILMCFINGVWEIKNR